MRIHIFGGPGSGKTTLASNLSKKLFVSAYDLDYFRFKDHDTDYSLFEDDDARDKKLKKVLSKKSWITEGSYTEFAWPCFVKADLIIILKTSFMKTSYRILKRFFYHKLGVKKRPKPELWRNLRGLLHWNYEFTYKRLPKIKTKLKNLEHKIIYVESKKDINSLFLKLNLKS